MAGLNMLARWGAMAMMMAAAPAMAQGGDDRFLHFGGETDSPRGYTELCQTMPEVCRSFAPRPVADPVQPPAAPPPGGAYCPDFACLPASSAMVQKPLPAVSLMLDAARQTGPLFPPVAPAPTVAALGTPSPLPAFTLLPVFRQPAPVVPAALPAPPADERQMERLIGQVNARVNHKVRQALDSRTYGRDDVWRPSGTGPGATGDCEDLALEKRLDLIAAGFPAERLFMAIVYRPGVGLHAVLVARLPSGDRVLDSRLDYIQRWARSGYAWLTLEQPGAPDRWFYAA